MKGNCLIEPKSENMQSEKILNFPFRNENGGRMGQPKISTPTLIFLTEDTHCDIVY